MSAVLVSVNGNEGEDLEQTFSIGEDIPVSWGLSKKGFVAIIDNEPKGKAIRKAICDRNGELSYGFCRDGQGRFIPFSQKHRDSQKYENYIVWRKKL